MIKKLSSIYIGLIMVLTAPIWAPITAISVAIFYAIKTSIIVFTHIGKGIVDPVYRENWREYPKFIQEVGVGGYFFIIFVLSIMITPFVLIILQEAS